MDINNAAEELKVIRQLMERPIRYSTMSGASGILAGVVALAGCLADSCISDFCVNHNYPRPTAFIANGLVWLGVFGVALAGNIVLTRIREKKQGMPFWSSVKRRILLTILPPFLAGAALTLVIALNTYRQTGPNEWGLIPSLWMAFYGVALWQVGEFSTAEIRVLGALFVLAAIPTAALWQAWPYVPMAVTFGGFHIGYGLLVWRRHGG